MQSARKGGHQGWFSGPCSSMRIVITFKFNPSEEYARGGQQGGEGERELRQCWISGSGSLFMILWLSLYPSL